MEALFTHQWRWALLRLRGNMPPGLLSAAPKRSLAVHGKCITRFAVSISWFCCTKRCACQDFPAAGHATQHHRLSAPGRQRTKSQVLQAFRHARRRGSLDGLGPDRLTFARSKTIRAVHKFLPLATARFGRRMCRNRHSFLGMLHTLPASHSSGRARSQTPDYHRRYAQNAAGSQMTCQARAVTLHFLASCTPQFQRVVSVISNLMSVLSSQ